VAAGDVVLAQAFGQQLRLEVPAEACASQFLRLTYHATGAITYAAVTAAAVATGAATAAGGVASMTLAAQTPPDQGNREDAKA